MTAETADVRDEIAEQLADRAGPGMRDLYDVDSQTRRVFREQADVIRGFIAAELRRLADPGAWVIGPERQIRDLLRRRADVLDPAVRDGKD